MINGPAGQKISSRQTFIDILKFCCDLDHSSGLAKTILQGTVKGGRRQGRQRKRWEEKIREWTGLEFGKSQRAVENREKWTKLVAKSSVVPHEPRGYGIDDDDDDDDDLKQSNPFFSSTRHSSL